MRTVKNGRELQAALAQVGLKLEQDAATQVLQKLSLDAWRFVMRRTPVDTGFLRSKWALEVGFPPTWTETRPGEGATFPAPPDPQVTGFNWGDTVTLYNNAEYASYVEEGTARQRAQPMIQPTYYAILDQANRLAKALGAKRYDV